MAPPQRGRVLTTKAEGYRHLALRYDQTSVSIDKSGR